MAAKPLEINIGGYTSAGVKSENQDAFAAYNATGLEAYYKGITAVVADGVSICERAKEASQVACTNFINDYYSTPETWTVKESAARVLNSLNSWLHQNGTARRSDFSEMVTTFSSVIFKSTTAHIFHVGDSSIWRYQDQQLEQLTRSHSIPQRNGNGLLSRALGMELHLEADYLSHELQQGDLFLLMSDGIESFIDAKELKQMLSVSYLSLEQCAKAIANKALANGSDDNLSVLLCKVDSLPQASLEETQRELSQRVIPPVMSIGNKIDDFVVEQILYSGTRSHLYLVRDNSNKKLVLKTPSENFSDDAAALESFIREQWIGQQLNHPNVMQVYKRELDSTFMYNLYEYLPAQTLRGWSQDNPQPSLLAVRELAQQMVSGLRAFQRKSMIHRDLKPENVMVDEHGQIKLIDFGTVKVNGLAEISTALREHAPVGSVNYIAPEYLMGSEGAYRSDIFSLGVIIYELLCGELPFKAMSDKRIPATYSYWQYRNIKEHRPDIPDWINGALEKACAPNPKDRYQAFSEFLHDLKQPNNSLVKANQSKPLAERNPVLLWQLISLALLIALVVSKL